MRLVTYQSANGPRLGVVRGDQIVTIPKLDMLSLIEQGDAGLDAARNAAGAVRSLKRTLSSIGKWNWLL